MVLQGLYYIYQGKIEVFLRHSSLMLRLKNTTSQNTNPGVVDLASHFKELKARLIFLSEKISYFTFDSMNV